MRGSSHLKCLADGTWNGTTPFCIRKFFNIFITFFYKFLAASCLGVKNNTAIGLFVQPESATIPYEQNVSIVCSQQNRPGKQFLAYNLFDNILHYECFSLKIRRFSRCFF